jgi:hypothetical protein
MNSMVRSPPKKKKETSIKKKAPLFERASRR